MQVKLPSTQICVRGEACVSVFPFFSQQVLEGPLGASVGGGEGEAERQYHLKDTELSTTACLQPLVSSLQLLPPR